MGQYPITRKHAEDATCVPYMTSKLRFPARAVQPESLTACTGRLHHASLPRISALGMSTICATTPTAPSTSTRSSCFRHQHPETLEGRLLISCRRAPSFLANRRYVFQRFACLPRPQRGLPQHPSCCGIGICSKGFISETGRIEDL